MFTLTRLSTAPASPLRIVVSQPEGEDAGLHVGGTFFFQPAGDEHGDDRAGMSEFAARAIMGDPELARHFRCEPALPPLAAPAAAAPAPDAPVAAARRGPKPSTAPEAAKDTGDTPAGS